MKDTKLYKIELGLLDGDGDVHNWNSLTVIAKDAPEAIKKTRLHKDEYVLAVAMVSTVDVK